MKGSAHVLLGEGRGKNLDMFLLKKANFIMIDEFRYGQTWKIWPSALSLSLYSTFKFFLDLNGLCNDKVVSFTKNECGSV